MAGPSIGDKTALVDYQVACGPVNVAGVGGNPTVFGEWVNPQVAPVLLFVILLAAAGTMALFIIAVLGYRRRRQPRFFIVALVIGALVVRSVVGLGTVFGVTPMTVHHLVEHSIDFLIAAGLLYAIYYSQTGNDTATEATTPYQDESGTVEELPHDQQS